MTVRLTPECLELLRETMFLTTHLGNTCLKNNSRQSKCHAFLLSSGISLALLALEEIWFLLIQEWPGWAVTLDLYCRVTLIRATTARSLCALFQLCPLECWDTGGRSLQPEQFSSCWNNWLLCKLVCSAGREAGRRKISSLCITRSRFGGSGKKPSCKSHNRAASLPSVQKQLLGDGRWGGKTRL